MLFNSISFAVFLPVVFLLYWLVAPNRPKAQNLLLLAASYFFYGCWDYRFLLLLLFSTALDYFTGLKIGQASAITARKSWLWVSIIINLGLLGFFKYYNFFIENFTSLLHRIGYHGDTGMLNIILPMGISFYTFHGLSYVFDIYRDKIKPSRNFIEYAVFVSFFPLLIAGPIERATHLLPQVKQPRRFDPTTATDGLRQILWGLFKKMVIADGSAQFVNMVFKAPSAYNGSDLAIGLFRIPDICRFLRLLRYRHRHRQTVWVRFAQEFCLPLFFKRHRRILEEMAYFTHQLVSRLPVYSPGRQRRQQMEDHQEYRDHFPGKRLVAWRQLDFYFLGRSSCPVLFATAAQ